MRDDEKQLREEHHDEDGGEPCYWMLLQHINEQLRLPVMEWEGHSQRGEEVYMS